MNIGQGIAPRKHPEVYPYLVTRVVANMKHIMVLPRAEQAELVEIARAQASFNKLESCLVLAPGEALYLYPDGSEVKRSDPPVGGVLIHGRLRPCKAFPEDRELSARKDLLRKHIESLNQGGYLLGDRGNGVRKPTPREAGDLRGTQKNGVPKGLVHCRRCGEWRGTCLDLIPAWGECIVRVHCLCQNDNRCAHCGDPLYKRKLNADYYNTTDGKIWHVPGFCGLDHFCKQPALNQGSKQLYPGEIRRLTQ